MTTTSPLTTLSSIPYDFQIIAVDTATLPPLLLPLAKQQVRVDFTDDDIILTQYIGNAIEFFEFVSGQRVNKAEGAWKPPIPFNTVALACPMQPITSFQVFDADAVDVSLQYSIMRGSAVQPQYLVRKDGGVIPAGTTASLIAGYLTVAAMPTNVIGPILRVTGTLYEYRETVTTPIIVVPGWINDLITGNWIPRA